MDNYIMFEGRKIFLTDKQTEMLKSTQIIKSSPFARVGKDHQYYCIACDGVVRDENEENLPYDNGCFETANYCTDHDLMKQRALHETLNRLLWRFSMENDGDKLQLSDTDCKKWYIYYDPQTPSRFHTMYTYRAIHLDAIYFATKELADRALYDIVLPFIEAHPMYKI